jgi:hypothetical protein
MKPEHKKKQADAHAKQPSEMILFIDRTNKISIENKSKGEKNQHHKQPWFQVEVPENNYACDQWQQQTEKRCPLQKVHNNRKLKSVYR